MGGWWNDNTEAKMRKEILEHGSVTAEMEIYTDLHGDDNTAGWGDTTQVGYKPGRIYQSELCPRSSDSGSVRHNDDEFVGMHTVRIVGWGESDGVKYWHVATSWGKSWNGNGYFKILRGQNI